MQYQALPSIFVRHRQPLEGTTIGCPIVDEVAGPDIVLEPGRLLRATVGADPRFRAEFPGFSQPHRPLQPQFDPEPPDPLEVDRPAPADQLHMDSPVSVPRISPRQPFDLSGQGQLVAGLPPTISQARPRPPHDATGPPLRDPVVLGQVIRRRPLLVGGHHFFFARSWSICLSSISSATVSRPVSWTQSTEGLPFQVDQFLGSRPTPAYSGPWPAYCSLHKELKFTARARHPRRRTGREPVAAAHDRGPDEVPCEVPPSPGKPGWPSPPSSGASTAIPPG